MSKYNWLSFSWIFQIFSSSKNLFTAQCSYKYVQRKYLKDTIEKMEYIERVVSI